MVYVEILIALTFAGLSGLFIWLYFKFKNGQLSYEQKYIDRSRWSFIGFWSSNRSKIIIFMAMVFMLLSLSFVLIASGINIDYTPI